MPDRETWEAGADTGTPGLWKFVDDQGRRLFRIWGANALSDVELRMQKLELADDLVFGPDAFRSTAPFRFYRKLTAD